MSNCGAGEASQSSQGSVEGISELLKCYICMEPLKDASLCPYCSKLGCFGCIQRWVLQKPNCPHCRQPLTTNDLIKIPIFDDLRSVLEALRKKQSSMRDMRQEGLCSLHAKEKLSVYCESCLRIICPKCALWGQHQGHSVKPLEKFHERQKEVIEAELRKLRDSMKEVLSRVQQLETKMEGVKVSKAKMKREISETVDKIIHRLEKQTRDKLQKLGESRRSHRSRAVEITELYHELQAKISSGSFADMIDERGALQPELKVKLQKLQNSSSNDHPKVGELVNEMVPCYDSQEFKMRSFCDLQQRGEEIYSDPIVVYGLKWRLKVYPNGHRDDTGLYLGIFLELTEGFEKATRCQYYIEMLYSCSGRHLSRNYKKEFVSDFVDGESWGYKRFYELSRLEQDGFLRDNTLVIRFGVRAPSYAKKCQDIASYVTTKESALNHHIKTLQQQVTELKNSVGANTHSPSRSSGRSQHSSPRTHHRRTSPSTSSHPHTLAPHEPHHQHSHSAPAPTPSQERLHSDRDADSAREHERERRHRHYDSASQRHRHHQLSASQQPIGLSSAHGHTHSRYLSQSRQHSDSQIIHSDVPPTGRQLMERRRSHEDADPRHRSSDHRRSHEDADPRLCSGDHRRRGSSDHPRRYDSSVTSSSSYGPSLSVHGHRSGLSQSHQELLSGDNAEPNGGGGRKRLSGTEEREREGLRGWSLSHPSDALTQPAAALDDPASGEEEGVGSLTHWDTVHPSDVTVIIDEEDDRHTSASSSTSTIVQSESPPNGTAPAGAASAGAAPADAPFSQPRHQPPTIWMTQSSQEPPDDLEPRLPTLGLAVPHGPSQPPYDHYAFEQDTAPPAIHPLPPSAHPLSQSSPLRCQSGRHRTSLNDVSHVAGTGGSNLLRSQFLSQSVREVSLQSHRDSHGRFDHTSSPYASPYTSSSSGFSPSVPPHKNHSRSHGQLNRLVSETRLDGDRPPGLSSSITAAMDRNQDEIQRRQHRSHTGSAGSPGGRGIPEDGRGTRSRGRRDQLQSSSSRLRQGVGRSASSANSRGYSVNRGYGGYQDRNSHVARRKSLVTEEDTSHAPSSSFLSSSPLSRQRGLPTSPRVERRTTERDRAEVRGSRARLRDKEREREREVEKEREREMEREREREMEREKERERGEREKERERGEREKERERLEREEQEKNKREREEREQADEKQQEGVKEKVTELDEASPSLTLSAGGKSSSTSSLLDII